jgi:hypothetical protein
VKSQAAIAPIRMPTNPTPIPIPAAAPFETPPRLRKVGVGIPIVVWDIELVGITLDVVVDDVVVFGIEASVVVVVVVVVVPLVTAASTNGYWQ